MKTKIDLTETNLISLIKRILLEQTDKMPDTYAGDVTPIDEPYKKTTPTDEPYKNTTPMVINKQVQRYCPNGVYVKVESPPYYMCSQSDAIKPVQKELKVYPDGKFGINTLYALYNKYKKMAITSDMLVSGTPTVNPTVTEKPLVSPTVSEIPAKKIGLLKIEEMYDGIFVRIAYIDYEQKTPRIQLKTGITGGKTYTTSCKRLNGNKSKSFFDYKKNEFIDININLNNKLKNHFCKK
jgi:hypothetical protein